MAENRENLVGEKVRVPPELMAELRQIIGAAQLRGEKKPAAGDLLWAAWQTAKEKGEIRVPEDPPQAVQDLQAILASGDDDLIGLVVKPLEYARKRLRGAESGKGASRSPQE